MRNLLNLGTDIMQRYYINSEILSRAGLIITIARKSISDQSTISGMDSRIEYCLESVRGIIILD